MIDWLTSTSFYWIFSITLLVLGAAAICFAFIGDRWRYGTKTPRCQRCRYDMTGVRADDTLRKCPECGHEHKTERLLHRPRLKYKRLIVGVLLVWVSLYLLLSPDMQVRMEEANEPWHIAAIPDTLRLAAWPWLNNEQSKQFGNQWVYPPGPKHPKTPLVLLDEWQARWFVNQLARDSRSIDVSRREMSINLAAGILQQYATLQIEVANILQAGIRDADDMVLHTSLLCYLMTNIEPPDSDIRHLLNIVQKDPVTSSTQPALVRSQQCYALDILTAHASRIPESEVTKLRDHLTRIVTDYRFTAPALSCLWAIDPQKAARVFSQLMRHSDFDVGKIAINETRAKVDAWSVIADYYRECPVDREDYLLNELERRDNKRWQALVAELQASPNPLLRAKAQRGIKYLKEFEDWNKSGKPALYAPAIDEN